jgi:hypothetical protein
MATGRLSATITNRSKDETNCVLEFCILERERLHLRTTHSARFLTLKTGNHGFNLTLG